MWKGEVHQPSSHFAGGLGPASFPREVLVPDCEPRARAARVWDRPSLRYQYALGSDNGEHVTEAFLKLPVGHRKARRYPCVGYLLFRGPLPSLVHGPGHRRF